MIYTRSLIGNEWENVKRKTNNLTVFFLFSIKKVSRVAHFFI